MPLGVGDVGGVSSTSWAQPRSRDADPSADACRTAAWSGEPVVVADRFTTEAGDRVPTILGTKEVTIRTEGFAFGVQFGGSYYLSENWIAGANFRVYRWILPETPR